MTVTRHAHDPLHQHQALCGDSLSHPQRPEGEHQLVDVGHQVNCPECRVVINFVRRCVSVSGYTCVRVA